MPPLLLVLLAALAAAAGQPLQPGQVYRVVESGSITFVAPSVALEAREALDIVSTPTLEACAAACRQLVDCTEFEYCAVPAGCKQAEPKELYMDCRLIASNCSVLPTVEAAGNGWIQRVSGFPLRHTPIELPDFTTAPAQVLAGGDFDCPGSILPGRCAFRSVHSAVSICSSMARCRSVLQYHNGTDGCSEPVAVLSTSWPTETNSYVAPTVDVLTKKTDKMMTTMLMAADGVVLEPSEADLAAAANASDPSTAWLGCIMAEGALMDGSVVAVADGVATAEDCCRACRANSKCNVWNHCSQQGGCSFAASSPLLGQFTVNLTQGQCELRYQETVATGWPPIVLAKGADVPLTAGAPLAVAGQQLPGYVALPGRAAFDYGMFECAESAWPELKQCILVDQPAQLAAKCSSIPDCVAMVIKPVPGLPSSLHAGNLRNAFNTSELGLSPTDLMYVRVSVLAAHSSGSSSGLSGGAVAGIAVGACAAAAALTAWDPSHTPSPFAAQATTPFDAPIMPPSPFVAQAATPIDAAATPPSPFAAQAATPIGSAVPATAAGSSVAVLEGINSRRYTSSRNAAVLSVVATEAEAAATAAASMAAAAAASASGTGSSGHDSFSHSSEEQPLPELAQYVAQCDAACNAGLRGAPSLAQELTSISIDSLPPSLRASVVDVSQIRYLTGPGGELQELGKGASGTVYRALYLDEIVAAKEIDIGRSLSMQEAFVNEALRLHQLHHPHVVALLGVTIAGSTGILLMEYCAGRDLRSALGLTAADSNERIFGWYRRGRRVVSEIAKALNFLHARGVVHMDVKSNNVLLTSGGTAKLADVGLSLLQTGTFLSDVPVIGTFAWVAPEILVGSKQCSSAVDIYSLGVVMWEIITGERPKRGSLRMPVVPDECPQEMSDLMMECLSLEPSQRPTASQVVRRLENGRGRLDATSVVVPFRAATSAAQSAGTEPPSDGQMPHV
ncbi:hypothetical protein COHA_003366 [Chlorella ohadii]|uniref:Protein kinase domain-containing protein n=1 Tax=Chlorella ohadii TaxID=2649997 RepID=A0AAD5H3K7_9CHLO|nr:hypothetical protein COHA_003366 [Chlorella ohadii]